MKIAVSSYSFNQLLSAGKMTQLDCVSKAKEMGFDAIEFTDLKPHDGSTAEEYAACIKAECERCGLPVSNYTVGADFLKNGESEIESVCRKVDIAAILGTSSMRHDAASGWVEDDAVFDDALPALTAGCRAVTEYATAKGIRTMVENHGGFCQDSTRVEKLMKAVDHPNFGWLIDVGNFACVNENSLDAVRRAAPYVSYVHAKDFYVRDSQNHDPGRGFSKTRGGVAYLRGAIVGHGDLPVAACLQLLRNSGYDGFVGLEFEGMEDALIGIEIGMENLLRILS